MDEDGSGFRYLVAWFYSAPPELRLQKRASDGTLVWEKSIPNGEVAPGLTLRLAAPGVSTLPNVAHVTATPRGELLFLGRSAAGFELVRLSQDGELACHAPLEPSAYWCASPTSDASGNALVQCISDPDSRAVHAVRFDSDCAPLWSADYALPAVMDPIGNVFALEADKPSAAAGGELHRYDPAGREIWSKVFEHLVDPSFLGLTANGDAVLTGTPTQNPRWDGAPWTAQNVLEPDPQIGENPSNFFPRRFSAVRPDGSLRRTTAYHWNVDPLAIDPLSGALLATRYQLGNQVALIDVDGGERWAFSSPQPQFAGFGPDGDLFLTLFSPTPVEIGGTRIETYDGASPVFIDLEP